MATTTITMERGDQSQPWGFRIHGGVDFNQPLIILKVTAGSLSAQSGLLPADEIISVNGQDVICLRHREAQQLILGAGNKVSIEVLRGGEANLERVHSNDSGQICIQSLRQVSSSSTTVITTSSSLEVESSSGVVVAPVSPGWRGPKYTEESIAESLHSQSQVLQTGAIGVNFMRNNEKHLDLDKSEVLKMLKAIETGKASPSPQPPPLSPSAAGLITRAYDVAVEAQQTQASWASQLSPRPRTATPVQ